MTLILSGSDGLSDVDGSAATPAIRGTDANTGIFFPAADTIAFSEGGVEAARFDASGNFGLGVTPNSAWTSNHKVIQFGATGVLTNNTSQYTALATNYYNATGGDIYIANGFATRYYQLSGQHVWNTAPSGTANNVITFTQTMTLDASGRLGIGTTSPSEKLQLEGSGSQYMRVKTTTTNADMYFGITSSSVGYVGTGGSDPLAFYTGGTERARIDSSGNLLVGTTSASGSGASSGKQVVQFNGAATNGIYLDDTRTASGIDNALIFGRGANAIGTIDTDLTLFRVRAVGALTFAANSAEAARIDTSGNLLVGTTSASAKLHVNATSTVTDWALNLTNVADTPGGSNYYFVDFRTNALVQTGYIWSNGGTTTSYATSSDYRLKENIAPITGALAKVAQLKPSTWSWKVNGQNGQGFIAHELQAICPDAVSGEKDGLDKKGNPRYQAVDTSFLVATLTAAIQELNAKFEEYKSTHP
jgi:hypothetical protein